MKNNLGNSLVVQRLRLVLLLLRSCFQFLVGELKSHKLCGTAKKKKKSYFLNVKINFSEKSSIVFIFLQVFLMSGLIEDRCILISASAFNLLWHHRSGSLWWTSLWAHSGVRVRRQIMFSHYYEHSFDLMVSLKRSWTPPGVPRPHLWNTGLDYKNMDILIHMSFLWKKGIYGDRSCMAVLGSPG